MKITKIKACREEICLYTDDDGAVTVTEFASTVGGAPAREISRTETAAVNGVITLPRFEGKGDRIFSRFPFPVRKVSAM